MSPPMRWPISSTWITGAISGAWCLPTVLMPRTPRPGSSSMAQRSTLTPPP